MSMWNYKNGGIISTLIQPVAALPLWLGYAEVTLVSGVGTIYAQIWDSNALPGGGAALLFVWPLSIATPNLQSYHWQWSPNYPIPFMSGIAIGLSEDPDAFTAAVGATAVIQFTYLEQGEN